MDLLGAPLRGVLPVASSSRWPRRSLICGVEAWVVLKDIWARCGPDAGDRPLGGVILVRAALRITEKRE